MTSLPPNVRLVDGWESEPSLSQDFTCIYQWMHRPEGLGMKFSHADCIIYARIWGASHDGVGVYCESQKKLAETFGFSRKTVCLALGELVRRGYVNVVGYVGNEKTGVRAYRCAPDVANRAIAAIMDLDELRRSLSDERREALRQGAPDPGAQGEITFVDTPSGAREPGRESTEDGSSSSGTEASGADSADDAPLRPRKPAPPATAPAAPSGGASESQDAADREGLFRLLLKKYPKSCTGGYRKEAWSEFNRLLDEGYTLDDILKALSSYLEDHRSRNEGQVSTRYLKSLNNFLCNASGARLYLPSRPVRQASAPDVAPEAPDAAPPRPSFRRVAGGRGDAWIGSVGDEDPIEFLCPRDATQEQLLEAYERTVKINGS